MPAVPPGLKAEPGAVAALPGVLGAVRLPQVWFGCPNAWGECGPVLKVGVGGEAAKADVIAAANIAMVMLRIFMSISLVCLCLSLGIAAHIYRGGWAAMA